MGAIALGALGIAASTYGSSRQAASANAAARNAQGANAQQQNSQRDLYGSSLFGVDQWAPYQDVGGYLSPERKQQLRNFNQMMGGDLFGQSNRKNEQSAADAARLPGLYADETRRLSGVSDDFTNQLAGHYKMGGKGLLDSFDQRAAGVMENARGYGRGREAIINQDSAKSLKAANQMSGARLAASGFSNSTAAANAYAGNARGANDSKQRQLQDLSDSQAGLTTGVAAQNLGQRTNLAGGIFNQGASALERSMAQGLDVRRSRAEGQAGQEDIAHQRAAGYRMAPVNFAMNALGGQNLNPYGDHSASLQQPGYSAAGSAFSTGGNAAAGLGSMAMFSQLQNQQKGQTPSGYGQWNPADQQIYNGYFS